MKIFGIDHLGMVARNHDVAENFFKNVLGLDKIGSETVSEQKVDVSFLNSFSSENSVETRIELLNDNGGGPIASYKEKFGGGIHHLALKVDSVDDYFSYLKSKDIIIVNDKISYGAGGHRVFFVHPKSTGGFLVEFSEVHNV